MMRKEYNIYYFYHMKVTKANKWSSRCLKVSVLSKNVNCQYNKCLKISTCYTDKWLGSCLKTKDRMKFGHEHDLMYHVKCPEDSCSDHYIGESGRRMMEQVKYHNGRDKTCHMIRHYIEKSHTEVKVNDFKVTRCNSRNNVRKRKLAEELLIKQFRSTLNVQEQSVASKLLNF